MAQTKTTSQSRTSGKKTTSTAKQSGGAKSGAKKPAGTKNGTAAKNAPVSTGRRSAAAQPAQSAQRPIRREVAAVILLFYALVALICYFDVDAWLITAFRKLCCGLFGWGYYTVCPALLLAAAVMGFHKGRPVTGRFLCAMLIPLLFGSCIHLILCRGEDYLSGGTGMVISGLWNGGLLVSSRCGGVLSGLLDEALEYLISPYGAGIVLFISLAAVLYGACRVPFGDLREKMAQFDFHYEPQDYGVYDDDDRETDKYADDDDFGWDDYPSVPRKKSDSADSLIDELFSAPAAKENTVSKSEKGRSKPAAQAEKPVRVKKKDNADNGAYVQPRPVSTARRMPTQSADPYEFEKEESLLEQHRKRTAKTAEPESATTNVKPVSLSEAAAIAGVELQSDRMDAEPEQRAKPEKMNIDKAAEARKVAEEIAKNDAEEKPVYQFPPIELLEKSTTPRTEDRDEIDKNRERLESTIKSFGVTARVVDVTHGSTVTRYDLELARGVKLSKLTNLAGDIALSLGVVSVRIAPIPGKISTVGVEVPNSIVTTVWLRDIIASNNFERASSKLSFAIGMDIGCNAIIGNISKLPHLLIAGTTGSGKSVCINSLILSLLYKSTPDEVKMIMIDPKMVELGIYNGMPHLYVPVVTDPKKAAGALKWSEVEMLKRYRLFADVGVRDLAGYNAYQRRIGEKTMPQVVIIIDELADLMMVASKEVEDSIVRVAQMGRAAGMHLVIATQRPSAEVITGLMKANIPSRIAFAVSSAMESRIIIDQAGAEKLIGQGDMLYCPIGGGKGTRVQGAFVTDEERERVIEYIKKDCEATYSDEILEEIEKSAAAADKGSKNTDEDAESDSGDDYDPLLPDAVDVALEQKKASVSILQRKLRLGYSRAARIVDQMEELGVVGPYEGSKPRKVIITREQWQEMQYSTGVAPADKLAGEFSDVEQDAGFAQLPEEQDEYDNGEDELL